ncbi:MAG: hypothetical protein HY276_09210 [Ignavibacteriales bacterium]|nr:hypothetical protein [Ignavibacteriales bacterium]
MSSVSWSSLSVSYAFLVVFVEQSLIYQTLMSNPESKPSTMNDDKKEEVAEVSTALKTCLIFFFVLFTAITTLKALSEFTPFRNVIQELKDLETVFDLVVFLSTAFVIPYTLRIHSDYELRVVF